MLEELIKLSQELSRLDLTGEAVEIKDMIERLYGSAIDTPEASAPDESFDDESVFPSIPSEELSILLCENANNDDFIFGLADVLINNLDEEALESIMNSISEVLS